MTLVYITLSWLSGIALRRADAAPLWLLLMPAVLGLFAFVLTRNQRARVMASCLIALSLGAGRMMLAEPTFDEGHIASYNDTGVIRVQGMVIDAPDVRDTHTNLQLRVTGRVLDSGEVEPLTGEVLVQAALADEVSYGSLIEISGQIETPPEWEDFSYRDYLARQGIHSLMRYVQVDTLPGQGGSPVRRALLSARGAAFEMINRLLPDPQASLLSGILLGIETGIPENVRASFDAADATHIIAISGSNLVILAGLVMAVSARFANPRVTTGITIAVLLVYSLFVGGDAAVMRAAVMVSLSLIAVQLGRQTYGLTSLAFAALLFTVINPLTLWDLSFQLSFMATLGLVLYSTPLQNLSTQLFTGLLGEDRAMQITSALSDGILVTMAVQLTTRPLMMLYFGRFSLVSLPVNLLIGPLQPPLMMLGGIGTALALLIEPLGQVFLWGSWAFLSLTLGIVEFFAGLSAASMEVSILNPLPIILFYGVLFGLTALVSGPEDIRKKRFEWLRTAGFTKAVAAVALLVAGLLLTAAVQQPDDRLHLWFFDVGDGSAVLIETPEGRQVLVDAGGSGRALSTGLGRAVPYWDRQIDLLVLTGQDERQVAALGTISRRYTIEAVLSGSPNPENANAFRAFGALPDSTEFIEALPGSSVHIGDEVILTVLHRDVDTPSQTVLMLTYRSMNVLFTGDIDPAAEAVIVGQHGELLDSAVIQVPRSGHRESSSGAFLAVVRPQVAVISVDNPDRSDRPHLETLTRLEESARVLRTDQAGTVHIVSDGEQMWVYSSSD